LVSRERREHRKGHSAAAGSRNLAETGAYRLAWRSAAATLVHEDIARNDAGGID